MLENLFGGGSNVASTSYGPNDFGGGSAGGSNWATSLFGQNAGTDFLGKIPPGALLAAAPLAMSYINGQQALPGEKSLQAAAGAASQTGQAFGSYMFSGTLPPGLQSLVDSKTNAAKAAVTSSYAKLGLSGSTMEAQALQQVEQSSAAQAGQFAMQLGQMGIDYTRLSAQELDSILTAQQNQQSDFSKALASFAGGLAGSTIKG